MEVQLSVVAPYRVGTKKIDLKNGFSDLKNL